MISCSCRPGSRRRVRRVQLARPSTPRANARSLETVTAPVDAADATMTDIAASSASASSMSTILRSSATRATTATRWASGRHVQSSRVRPLPPFFCFICLLFSTRRVKSIPAHVMMFRAAAILELSRRSRARPGGRVAEILSDDAHANALTTREGHALPSRADAAAPSIELDVGATEQRSISRRSCHPRLPRECDCRHTRPATDRVSKKDPARRIPTSTRR